MRSNQPEVAPHHSSEWPATRKTERHANAWSPCKDPIYDGQTRVIARYSRVRGTGSDRDDGGGSMRRGEGRQWTSVVVTATTATKVPLNPKPAVGRNATVQVSYLLPSITAACWTPRPKDQASFFFSEFSSFSAAGSAALGSPAPILRRWFEKDERTIND